MMDYSKWVRECLKAFTSYDKKLLIHLLFKSKITGSPSNQALRDSIQAILEGEFEVSEGESALWVIFLAEHIDARSRKHQIFRHLNLAYQSLVKIYKEDDQGYLHIGILKLYSAKLLKEGSKISNLKEVLNSLRMLISACQCNTPLPNSQVIGLYFSINIAFRASFRLNNLQHIASLLRIVNSEFSKFPPLTKYPKSEQVEFKFYEGRYHIYENNIIQAEQCLDFAFTKCSSRSMKNKSIILRYLIPVKAIRSKIPSQNLLEKYGLGAYGDMLNSVKQGNIKEYNEYLRVNQYKHIQQGIIVIMDSLKLLVYRNLFKKVHAILRENQITMSTFARALKAIGVTDVSLLEIECIFINLIFNNWLKATINSPSKIVIFRDTTPFPKITNSF